MQDVKNEARDLSSLPEGSAGGNPIDNPPAPSLPEGSAKPPIDPSLPEGSAGEMLERAENNKALRNEQAKEFIKEREALWFEMSESLLAGTFESWWKTAIETHRFCSHKVSCSQGSY